MGAHIDRSSSSKVTVRRAAAGTVRLAPTTGPRGPEGPASTVPGPPGGSDESFAAWVNDTGSATRGALSATFARKRAEVPRFLTAMPPLSDDIPTRTAGSYPTSYREVPYTTNKVSRGAVVPSEFTAQSFTSQRNAVNHAGSLSPWWIEFDYYGQDFSFRGRDNVGANAFLWMWVDGKPITAAPENSGANARDFAFGVRFQWASKRTRRIRLYFRGSDFTALRLSPTDSISPTRITEPRSLWLGDSWFEGAFDVTSLITPQQHAARLLGWQCFSAGQGGTGYYNNGGLGGKLPFRDPARLAAAVASQPEYIVIAGSINDDAVEPKSSTVSYATETFATLASLAPNAKVIVVGPQTTGTTVSAGRAANRDAVQQAAQAASNVVGFIDPIAEQWITGTGKIGATTGDGPADVLIQTDGSHLSAPGAEVWGRRMAEAILRTLNI